MMKIFKGIILLFLTLTIWMIVSQYFFCPYYYFPQPEPFRGQQFYNPYEDLDSGSWYKCNFHAHSNCWSGLTNGEGNGKTVWNSYDSLGYAIHCVSEYQKVDTTFRKKENYIPAYEHGYNLYKTHQLVLGNHHPLWLDYVLPQTLSNKQQILNSLNRDQRNVVILNHPRLRSGYSVADLGYLDGYQCMEVLNPKVSSFAHWDAALSAGKPIFIVGNDDTHNINNPRNIGRQCTWLNLERVTSQHVLSALKKGQGYGMTIPELKEESLPDRVNRIKNKLPFLKSCSIRQNVITITVSNPASKIFFTGQNGNQLADTVNTTTARYLLSPQDTYVRCTIRFEDGTTIYLNPLFRFTGDILFTKHTPYVNSNKTSLFHFFGTVILFVWFYIAFISLYYKKRSKLAVGIIGRQTMDLSVKAANDL